MRAVRNERRHFFFLTAFVYHNNHLGERKAIREISFFSFWSFSRAAHRGLGERELYFAGTSIYENERDREKERKGVGVHMSIYTHVYMWTASIVTTRERKGQNRNGILQLLLLMHARTICSAYSTRIHV